MKELNVVMKVCLHIVIQPPCGMVNGNKLPVKSGPLVELKWPMTMAMLLMKKTLKKTMTRVKR